MYIPKSMKNKISSYFYDKDIYILEKEVKLDSEGGVITKGLNAVKSFKGNVKFKNFKQIQENYGLMYDIDLAITTDYEDIKVNDIVEYINVVYKVVEVIKCDSHTLIVGRIWKQ